jgi:hypothetical protein
MDAIGSPLFTRLSPLQLTCLSGWLGVLMMASCSVVFGQSTWAFVAEFGFWWTVIVGVMYGVLWVCLRLIHSR